MKGFFETIGAVAVVLRPRTLLPFLLFLFVFLALNLPVFAAELSSPKFVPLDLLPFLPVLRGKIPANQIVLSSEHVPDWKKNWDTARSLARQDEHEAARIKYKEVLALKGNLNEARWELVVLLLKQDMWDEAAIHLDYLIASEPENKLYVLLKATLAQRDGHYEHSIELFKRGGGLSVSDDPLVLSGLVNGFFAVGEKKESLEMLLNLVKLKPKDEAVRLNVAVLAFALKRYELAKKEVGFLLGTHESDGLLLLAARVYGKLGQEEEAAEYWQKLQAFYPGNIEVCETLAHYYEERGEKEKSLVPLLVLVERRPEISMFNKRIALAYMSLGKFDKAQSYLEKYLSTNPNDIESSKAIIKIHAAKGERSETLAALEHYFAVESKPAEGNLQQAATLYREGGFFKEAIPLYQRLLDISPDDPKILWALAQTLLASGQEEDSLAAWRQLSEVVPGALVVYRPMAELLERLGRECELIEVLNIIHRLAPKDHEVIFKLAGLYFSRHNFEKSFSFLSKLSAEYQHKPEFFKWRGAIWRERGQAKKALEDFEALLDLEPGLDDVRLQCIRLAGLVDDLQGVRRHAKYFLEQSKQQISDSNRLVIARAFFDSGGFGEAEDIYMMIIGRLLSVEIGLPDIKKSKEDIFATFQGLAEVFKAKGLLYEAEQALRQGFVLSRDRRFMVSLFTIALEENQVIEAKGWLTLLSRYEDDNDWLMPMLRGRYQVATGQEDAASKNGDLLMNMFLAQSSLHLKKGQHVESDCFLPYENHPAWVGRGLDLIDLQISLSGFKEASDICQFIAEFDDTIYEAKILANVLYRESHGLFGWKFEMPLENMDHGLLLAYENIYRHREMFQELERVASYVRGVSPGSLRGALFLAEAQVKLGQKKEASLLYNELLLTDPGNKDILVLLAKLHFSMGHVAEAQEIAGQFDPILGRSDIALLQARISWLQNNWQESIALYAEYLHPSVEELVKSVALEFGAELPAVQHKANFFEKMGLAARPIIGVADKVMEPQFVGLGAKEDEKAQKSFSMAITRLYARFRWQKKFADELQVRQAVQRREYVLAAKKYELFIKRNPEDVHLLFDLAGVYSRLGRLGDESALYNQLEAQQIDYPGLADAVARNRLKQRPYVSADFGYLEEKGRQGQQDMRQDWQGVALWYSPGTQQNVDVTLSRVNYQGEGTDVVRANRFFTSYESMIWPKISLGIGAGIHHEIDSHGDLFLAQADLVGKFGDTFTGRFSFRRDIVADTVTSVSRGIVQNYFESGISVDILTRLELAADYVYVDYSDSNWTTGYNLRAAYILLSEPTFLKIKYKYDFKESQEEGTTSANSGGNFLQGDFPYWSPTNYWQNSVGLFFKHSFGKNTLGREVPRYYTAEYYLGHDVDGYGFQTLKLVGCLEFSPEIFGRLTAEITDSQPFRKKQLMLSLSYRW